MAALTGEALWIQDIWRLRHMPLQLLRAVEASEDCRELTLTFGSDQADKQVVLTFAHSQDGRRWLKEINARKDQQTVEPAKIEFPSSEGVALVLQPPKDPYVQLGPVEFTGPSARLADRGLQLRAGMRGADAVIGVSRVKCPDYGQGARHATGLTVRVENSEARDRLRESWFSEEVKSLVRRMLVLVVVQAVLLLVVGVVCAGASAFKEPTGLTLQEELTSTAIGLAIMSSWPLALLLLLRALRWPHLLAATGLAIMAVTTIRGLVVLVAHFLGVRSVGASPAGKSFFILVDPVDWAIIFSGAYLAWRAWRLQKDAQQILPEQTLAFATPRKNWSRGLLAATAVLSLVFLGFVGKERYQMSADVFQPGADPQRENKALLTFNQALSQLDRNDFVEAEKSLQSSLKEWEELTAKRPHPTRYRINLAQTLYNLAWIRHKQGRLGEAETYYLRFIGVGQGLANDPEANENFQACFADAQRFLADMKAGKTDQTIEEKYQKARLKYEEGVVKSQQADPQAEGLFLEAIGLWEEILPQATSPEQQKIMIPTLASSYLFLGEVRQQTGKTAEAEGDLLKAIDYGERAVALAPDRPLAKHYLDQARQLLEYQREKGFRQEIDTLLDAERYAEVFDVYEKQIADLEKRVNEAKNRQENIRRLSYRLNRFAWFLAHCPDDRIRDPKKAVGMAHKATNLAPDMMDNRFTLALALYRMGNWKESLESLKPIQVKDGEYDAACLFLIAMNRHRLKQKEEARTAFRQAMEWFDERTRKAEKDPTLRYQLEMMRPTFELLKREAQGLLEGKDSSDAGIG
jgi:tetratricopeptide (TPR) repeat protein